VSNTCTHTFRLGRGCGIITYLCRSIRASRSFGSLIQPTSPISKPSETCPTAPHYSTMSPPTIFFVSKLFSRSPTISHCISTIHYSPSSHWHRTRKTCCYYSCWSSTYTCCSCSETRLGSRPPPCQFESGPPCIGMDTPMIEFYFFSIFLSTIDFFWLRIFRF
jgi:hypothetical protein